MPYSPDSAPIILDPKTVQRCHIYLPDTPKPTSAIAYQGQFYSYVKHFPTAELAQRAANRLLLRGNSIVFTQVSKGLVLWVLETEAYPASKHLIQ